MAKARKGARRTKPAKKAPKGAKTARGGKRRGAKKPGGGGR